MPAEIVVVRLQAQGGDDVVRALREIGSAAQVEFRKAGDAANAANDNAFKKVVGVAKGIGEIAGAYSAVASLAREHPQIVAAGAAVSARAIGSVAGALGGAATAARGLASEHQRHASIATSSANVAIRAAGLASSAVSAGAGVAARGLSATAAATMATASAVRALGKDWEATAAKSGAGTSLLSNGASLLLRTVGSLPPALAALAAGLVVFKVASSVIEKASGDLEKMVELGKQAESLDIGAPFLKSFTGLGAKLRLEVAEMEAALKHAADLVKDKFGQPNALASHLDELQKGGFTGGQRLQASSLLDFPTTVEERIRAAAVAMKELGELGQKWAMLATAEKFTPQLVEPLRSGRITAAQLLADLDEASKKQVLKQEDVARAVELSRRIEDVKKEVAEAVKYSFDLSGLAVAIDTQWLALLETVRDVVEWMNRAKAEPPGPPREKLDGLLQSQQKYVDLLAKAEDAAAKGFPHATEKAAHFRKELERVTAEIAKIAHFFDAGAQTKRGDEREALAGAPDKQKIGARLTTEMFGPHAKEFKKPEARTGSSAAEKNDFTREEAALRRRIRDVEAEAAALGKNAFEAAKAEASVRLLTAAQQAKLTINEELTKKIDAQSEAYARQVDALDRARKELESFRQTQQMVGDGLVDAGKALTSLDKGTTVFERLSAAATRFVDRLQDAVWQAALLGQGPLAGLLGTSGSNGNMGGLLGLLTNGAKGLLGSGAGAPQPGVAELGGGLVEFGSGIPASFAKGGIMTGRGPLALRAYSAGGIADRPQLALYGEGRTPEAYVPLPDGRTIPVTMRLPGAGAAAAPITIAPVTNIDARGSQMSEPQFRAILDQRDRALVQALPNLIRDARGRGRLGP
jgi:hypothetical protein